MAGGIPSLWPTDIRVDVRTPLAILRSQVDPLFQLTKGLLIAKITTQMDDKGAWVSHTFELVAPTLAEYRYTVIEANHAKDRVYPVTVMAIGVGQTEFGGWPVAQTEEEFIEMVGHALRSPEVRSVIQSLLARINEERLRPAPDADAGKN
jgi:hypothetical protein